MSVRPAGEAAGPAVPSPEGAESGQRWSFEALRTASAVELERLLAAGEAPDPAQIAGWEYRGANHPWYVRFLGIQKFVKGFFLPPDSGPGAPLAEGYNCPVVQDGPARPWRTRPLGGEPKRFGFYYVVRVNPEGRDRRFPRALLLDYGASPRNGRVSPVRLLRDYLVRVQAGSDELLLGKADLALGPWRLPVSYFILERLRPHQFRG